MYKSDYAELNFGDIYNYYVSKENKDMTFLINFDYSKYFVNKSYSYSDYKLSFWARCGKSLNSTLNPQTVNSLIKDKYQAYLFTGNDINEKLRKFYLKVEGNTDDIINVGSLIFDDENICPIIFKDIGIEITGFFKKGLFEKNCFKFSNISDDSIKEVDYDIGLPICDDKRYDSSNNFKLVCYYLNKQYIIEEYLYSLQYINNGKKRTNLLSPQIIGKNYVRRVEKGEIIGLIPFKPDASFKFLSYYFLDSKGISESYIYECKSYPFCTIDSSSFKNSIQLRNIYESYSISFTNDEYGNISPISKYQKILLIKAKSRGYLKDITIYTNENNIMPSPMCYHYKYLRKDNNENLMSFLDLILNKEVEEDINVFLSLEILSGSATVSLDTPQSSLKEAIEYENKYSYIFKYAREGKRNILKIKANKNTAYKFIMNVELAPNMYFFQVGNNFLYEFKDNITEYELNFDNAPYSNKDNSYVYFKFFPLNCVIEVKNLFYSKILPTNEELISKDNEEYHYSVKRVDNKNESCKFYASTDCLDINRSINYMEATTISNNVTHYSIFNKEIDKIKYFYPHVDIENNLMVNFSIKNETNDIYALSVYINDNRIYYINSERENSLTLNYLDISKECKDDKQICCIYFLLEANNKIESSVEFKVLSLYSEQKSDNNNNNPNSENFVKKKLKYNFDNYRRYNTYFNNYSLNFTSL